MTRWTCGRPEWADEEDCPLETEEAERCAECSRGMEEEVDW